jgi:hypothetical protein
MNEAKNGQNLIYRTTNIDSEAGKDPLLLLARID